MKKILIPILSLCVTCTVSAHDLFEQLVAFNPNWQAYESRLERQPHLDFPSDKEYIQTHLTHVLEILRTNETQELSCVQLEQRSKLIEVLEGYKNRGLFPMNYYRDERIPVFIDEHNTHCAVGYLLMQTGYDDVARRIAAKNNYAWVKEIDDPALPEWQQFSGFTLKELKLIQGAYDFYQPFARTAPNKTEIPQKPAVVSLDFNGNATEVPAEKDLLKVWCYGEGKDDVLHGKWVQNYRKGTPWIVGYYENGNRTGSWKEYYQGTDILCRTEHWRNDKLNGVRTRYDREGNVIERITFKDGEAVLKVNYDLQKDLEWRRIPVDSITLRTEVYTLEGYLLAKGKEQIFNPSGRLQWFQDIELTALNTAAITARDGAPEYTQSGMPVYSNQNSFGGNGLSRRSFHPISSSSGIFNQGPTLVNYLKIGEWKFYNEYTSTSFDSEVNSSSSFLLNRDFPHFGNELLVGMHLLDNENLHQSFDSLEVLYTKGFIKDFKGFGKENFARFGFIIEESQNQSPPIELTPFEPIFHRMVIRGMGPLNKDGDRIGEWIMYDTYGRLTQYVKYVQPFKHEEPLTGNL